MAGDEGILERILLAIRLDGPLYRDVAEDETYTTEAILLATLVAFFGAIGAGFGSGRALGVFFVELLNSLLFGWILWTLIAYLVGQLMGGRSGMVDLGRALAYANTPRLLGLLGFIPAVGWVLLLVGWVLSMLAGMVAVRESMELDSAKAFLAAAGGLFLYVIVRIGIGVAF